MRRRILFVDDEPRVLHGLRRMLFSMREEWELGFAEGGEEALAKLAREPFDAIVSDVLMPHIDGIELLAMVAERYPGMIRIALSGHSERSRIPRAAVVTHQFLAKPCDPDELKRRLGAAFALRTLLGSESLRTAVTRLGSLPSLPRLYQRIVGLVSSDRFTLEQVGELVAQDLGTCAKVLQLVNSSFFGLRRSIADPVQAVVYLGVEAVKALALFNGVFSSLADPDLGGVSADRLWRHSVRVAQLAAKIVQLEEAGPRIHEEAFLGGLLHDAGQLLLAGSNPSAHAAIVAAAAGQIGGAAHRERERHEFGASHDRIAAYLFGLWSLPDGSVQAIAWHHDPSEAEGGIMLSLVAVHVADVLVHQAEGTASDEVDEPFLKRSRGDRRLPAWRDAARAILEEGA
jgi:HD-like signal output (HDOD) protein/ActR/RegA family two-component response regulator